MVNKLAKLALVILLFTIAWSHISNSFDPDLGWHLRFGKDAWQNNFQYTDTYTWSYFGLAWVNHEWGGDMLFWQLYSHLGYYSLIIITALSIFLAFYLATKIYSNKTTVIGLIIAAIALESSSHILVMRLAMLSPLFFVILWASLEKIPQIKFYWMWPILFWFWSAVHGSWILGFITINIYLTGNLIQKIIHRYYKYPESKWNKRIIYEVIAAEMLSLFVILVNPYGARIFSEVLEYFTQNFHKSHVIEWLPSYVFPVYWWPLIISAIALCIGIFLARRKKIDMAQMLLISAFFVSAFLYKRNAIFIVLVSIPLLAEIFSYAANKILRQLKARGMANFNNAPGYARKTISLLSLIAVLSLIFCYGRNIKLYNDIWRQKEIISNNNMPYEAVKFLQAKIGKQDTKIFNEFRWGGYLNWALPQALVFFDGRGTVTWTDPDNPKETMLQKYYHLKYDEPAGLEEIKKNGVRYIILQNSRYMPISAPDGINIIIFGNKLSPVYKAEASELEKSLHKSQDWQLVYSDSMANIWQRLPLGQD